MWETIFSFYLRCSQESSQDCICLVYLIYFSVQHGDVSMQTFFFNLIYLFMAVFGLRFCARAFSSCGKRGPLFIAVRGPLTIAASLVQHRLQTRRLSNCGSRAQLLRGMWDILPRPGLEPVSPALAGRLSTTAPPGKPSMQTFDKCYITIVVAIIITAIMRPIQK